jgi:hypothetical protein
MTEISDRPVALMARASDSKSECWGFESLLACINYLGFVFQTIITIALIGLFVFLDTIFN